MRSAERETALWSNVVLIGGAVAVAGCLVGAAVGVALGDAGDNQLGSAAIVTLNELSYASLGVVMLPLAIML